MIDSADLLLIDTEALCVCVFCQTAEEIDQLTVDEDLNDIERAVYLLRCVSTD